MVNQNTIFSFKIKRQAKNIFPRDVKRTVGLEIVYDQQEQPFDVQTDVFSYRDQTWVFMH